MNLDEWDKSSGEEIPTRLLDEVVKTYRLQRQNYDEAKKISNEAHAEYKAAELALVEMLARAGKTKYHVDGLGSITVVKKASVKVPKDPESKEKLFAWLREGKLFGAYATVHGRSLNSLYNIEVEKHKERGEIFNMPGVEAPTSSMDEIRFTKERK